MDISSFKDLRPNKRDAIALGLAGWLFGSGLMLGIVGTALRSGQGTARALNIAACVFNSVAIASAYSWIALRGAVAAWANPLHPDINGCLNHQNECPICYLSPNDLDALFVLNNRWYSLPYIYESVILQNKSLDPFNNPICPADVLRLVQTYQIYNLSIA